MESETKCSSLRQSLDELQGKLSSSEADRDNLSKMTQQLGTELEQLRTSMESSKQLQWSPLDAGILKSGHLV